MFIYLSKKIAIPNNTKINALAWNKSDGYIAVGGDDGLLKVLKLDSGENNETATRSKGLSSSSNLSMNQSLEGHNDPIQVLIWNEFHKKLTTSDQNGIIIVWMLYKGAWYEEMINNRKKSTVVGMSWSGDSTKICIIYEDGAVIVGSVTGNRIWGKELKNIQLSGVQWSPDDKLLLFSLKNGQIHLYDNQGNFVMPIEILCQDVTLDSVSIVGLDWYNGPPNNVLMNPPNLAICYENGRAQFMRNESDLNPVLLDTRLIAVHCSWNHNGSQIAISGRQFIDDKEINLVQFYNPFGEHLRTLKVPGNSINCCVWEGGSLRVALAVDSFVYFANIRPDYKWCYFKKTIVYATCRQQRPGICVSFWNIINNQCHTIYVPILITLSSYGDYCVLVTCSDLNERDKQYGLLLCNTLGTPVDGKYVDIPIMAVTMNSSYVIAASKNNFLIWQYKTPKSSFIITKSKSKLYHIDDNPIGAIEIIEDLDNYDKTTINRDDTQNPISCLTCSNKCLIIGRDNGILQYYALPLVVLVNRFKIQNKPYKMAINCSSTRLSIIDVSGIMNIIDISDSRTTKPTNENNKLERKDVWAMCWASDNPQLLAIMEKTRMYIFKGIYPEEPVSCSGYICSFNDLEIQAVYMDEIMESPEKPNNKNHLIKLEIKSLRDTQQLLKKVGINEAEQFIEENQHPRLWRLLAEAALKEQNLPMVESAFVRSRDYSGILFVKKLKDIQSESIRKAHAAIYFKNFDEAEKIFMESDRSDLALNLRQILGDWFRVIQILKNGVTAPDNLLKIAYNSTADYFVHLNNWSAAAEYYELADNKSELINCYYRLDDFTKLEDMINTLPDGSNLLKKIADIFAANGIVSEAVKAYIKLNDINTAIDLCILHNYWSTAIDLAKTHNLNKISDLFKKYTNHLLKHNNFITAIEINTKAKFFLTASENAFKLAELETKKSKKNLIKIKKLYVYGARLLQLHKTVPNQDEYSKFDPLIFENAWKGAEAYHFYMLAHEQLYSGKIHDALCTAYKVQDYSDYLNSIEIYSLLALIACLNRSFNICSKALIKLKSSPDITDMMREQYIKLALNIFTQNEPKDLRQNEVQCSSCNNSIADWNTVCPFCKMHFPTCTFSGKPIIKSLGKIWLCQVCHHPAYEAQIAFQNICLLCHSNKNK